MLQNVNYVKPAHTGSHSFKVLCELFAKPKEFPLCSLKLNKESELAVVNCKCISSLVVNFMLKLAPLPIFVYHRMTSQSWTKRKNMLQGNSGEMFHSSLACCHWKLLLQLWKVSIEWVNWVHASVPACMGKKVSISSVCASSWVSCVSACMHSRESILSVCIHGQGE